MKKTVLKLVTFAMVIALLATVLVACGGGDDYDSRFVGTWEHEIDLTALGLGVETMRFVYRDDGTGSITVMGETTPMTWSTDGNWLTLTYTMGAATTEELHEFEFTSNDVMRIRDADSGEWAEYTRVR